MMRIHFRFEAQESNQIVLPRVNLHLVQAMLYNLMSDTLADFLHETGYQFEKRRFKLFTFSWLQGRQRMKLTPDSVIFQSPVTLTISSPVHQILQDLAVGVLRKRYVRLGHNPLVCQEATIREVPITQDRALVRMLSPVTCYSTLTRSDGSPYTVYHHPTERAFREQILSNLLKKFRLLHPDDPLPEPPLQFRPNGQVREQIARFRPDDSRPIKGWWGTFHLSGPSELIQIALDAGLGAKNSAGWGCVEKTNSPRKENKKR